jgi:hypothetical protein
MKRYRVDWPRLVLNLRGLGWTVERIATAVHIDRQRLSSYCEPLLCEPRHDIGEALIALWGDECNLDRDSLPTVAIELSAASMR